MFLFIPRLRWTSVTSRLLLLSVLVPTHHTRCRPYGTSGPNTIVRPSLRGVFRVHKGTWRAVGVSLHTGPLVKSGPLEFSRPDVVDHEEQGREGSCTCGPSGHRFDYTYVLPPVVRLDGTRERFVLEYETHFGNFYRHRKPTTSVVINGINFNPTCHLVLSISMGLFPLIF